MTKPFNIIELKARIRALLRRSSLFSQTSGEACITVGHIVIDTEKRTAKRGSTPVELTAKEFDVIELLAKNPDRVFSRENLLNIIWGLRLSGGHPDGGRPCPQAP